MFLFSDYIHRSGRVGRVGALHHRRQPVIYNFVSQKWEVEVLWKLERAVRKAEVLPDVDANIKKQHEERHEEKSGSSVREGMEGVGLGAREDDEEKSARRTRMAKEGKPGLPGSRKLKRFAGPTFEF